MVSIVVAVHNAAKTLPRCLASLQAQSCGNLQIILVDDGSTDASVRICADASSDDERIEVLRQENAGPAAARNTGLDAVRGEWIMFVDADDALESGYVECMLAEAQRTGADVVVSECRLVDGAAVRPLGMIAPGKLYVQRDELCEDFLAGKMPWSLWGKLYRAELFENLRLDTGLYIAEDLDLNARLYVREGLKLATTDADGYAYTVAEGSIDHSFTLRHLCQFEAFERVVGLMEAHGVRTRTSAAEFYEERVLNCLRKAIAADALTPPVRAAFSTALAAHRREVLASRTAAPGLKLRTLATFLGPGVYARLNRLSTLGSGETR